VTRFVIQENNFVNFEYLQVGYLFQVYDPRRTSVNYLLVSCKTYFYQGKRKEYSANLGSSTCEHNQVHKPVKRFVEFIINSLKKVDCVFSALNIFISDRTI
jgi:hypothetical protein